MTDEKKFTLRLPEKLHTRLAKVAARNRTSLNSEITARLADSLKPKR